MVNGVTAEFGKFRMLSRLRKRSFPQRGPNPRKTRLAALRKPVAIAFPLATEFCNDGGPRTASPCTKKDLRLSVRNFPNSAVTP